MQCPLCSTELLWNGPGAEDGLGPLTSELRRFCLGPDPIAGSVVLCLGCGFGGAERRVSTGDPGLERMAEAPAWCLWGEDAAAVQPETLGDRVRRLLEAGVAGLEEVDPAQAWEHAAWIAAWRGDGPLGAGDAWLRAAWMHDDAERASDAVRCRQRALGCYQEALSDPANFRRRQDQAVVAYIAGEVARRLGSLEASNQLFESAVRFTRLEDALKDLVVIVRRQMTEPADLLEGR